MLRLLVLVLLAASPALAAPWQGGGPDIGWVTALLRPFGPEGPLYAGTYGGGIWRSEDDGATWVEATDDARDAVVWDLAIGNDVLSTLYAATEDRGLLRAESFSTRWRPSNAGLGIGILPAVYDVEAFPLDPTRIAVGTSTGAQVSSSRGSVWADTLRVSPVEPVRGIEILPATPRTVHYVGAAVFGVQRGSDTPVETTTAGLPGDAFLFDLAPWPGDPDRFVAPDFDGEVWQVVDGVGFTPLGAAKGLDTRPRFYRADVSDGGGGPVIRVGADRGLFTSTDAGTTWTRTAAGRSDRHAEVWEVLVDDAATGALFLGGFVDGVARVESGAPSAWIPRNGGLRAAWVRSVDARDGIVLAGTAHGRLYRSDDAALSWTEVTGSLDDLQIGTVWIGDGSPWVVTAAGGVYWTGDEGATWSSATLAGDATRLNEIVDAGAGRLLGASDDGLLESRDEGRTWPFVLGLDERRTATALVHEDGRTAVAFEPTVGSAARAARVLVDTGRGFRDVDVPRDARVRGLAFLDGDGGTLAVAFLPRAEGNLAFYADLDAASPPDPTYATVGPVGEVVEPAELLRVPASRRLVMATASHGVFLSDDAGTTWVAANEGLASLRTDDVALDATTPVPRLALGTFARGAWVRPLDDLVAVADPVDPDPAPVPRVTRLLPPAPNPFNPRTTIRWEQATDAPVTVEIFDLRGRRLRTLLRADLAARAHRVTWDGTDDAGRVVASGAYVARVRIGQRVLAARLTLLR